MKNNFFLWPKNNKFISFKNSFRNIKSNDVEKLLLSYFPSGYPILFSNGRSAILSCLIYKKLKKNDFVRVFPYASHCVLDTISRISFPLSEDITKEDFKLSINYHQWGFDKKMNNTNCLLEDSVDSLYIKKAKLFSQNGEFEIWSLPKILGTLSGGVLWCKNKDDCDNILRIRDKNKKNMYDWLIKIFNLNQNSIEKIENSLYSFKNKLSRFEISEIYNCILKWEDFVEDRLKKIDHITNNINLDEIYTKLEFNERLPCAIPIKGFDIEEKQLFKFGIETGFRMFDINLKSLDRNFKKTIPLPIHHQVSLNWIKKTTQLLNLI
jgi:putative PLP-dependent aminotransferase (TIGR04422 family)